MKLPSMTTGKHWLGLLALILIEAVLAFLSFIAGPPFSFAGLVLVIAGNIQLIGAVIAAYINLGKR